MPNPVLQIDSNSPGAPLLNAAKGQTVSVQDVTPGPAPHARNWSFASLPGTLASPPTITLSNGGQTATFTTNGSTDGSYSPQCTRTEITLDQFSNSIVVGVPDDDGHVLPPAGGIGDQYGTGGSPATSKRYGWMGGAEAGTNFMLDAYLRFTKATAKSALVATQNPTGRLPVLVATTGALPTNTYDNAAGTLTGSVFGALPAQDGTTLSVTTPPTRILVKDEATGAHNGLYVLTQVGDGSHPYILTRAPDANTSGLVQGSTAVSVQLGATNSGSVFALTTQPPITLGTTALQFLAQTRIRPEWFGAKVDGSNAATGLSTALAVPKTIVEAGRGSYSVQTDATVSVQEHRSLIGQGIESTTLALTAATDYGMFIESTVTGQATGNRIADVTITAPSATHYALGLKSSSDGSRILGDFEIERVLFKNCAGGAIQALPSAYVQVGILRHVTITACDTTAYLIDLFDANGTTINLENCYVSNNRDAADGCALKLSGDSVHLHNFVIESSGRVADMFAAANLRWSGGRCEDMFGPIINATTPVPGYGTVDIEGVVFERGPVGGATPVIVVQGGGLQSVRIRNCVFQEFRSCDLVLSNVSALDRDIDFSGCSFIACDAAFIAQFQRYAPANIFTSWTELALHSSIEDSGYTYTAITGSGGSAARDTTHKLDGDTASLALTWTAGATALIQLLNTNLSLFSPDTDDVVVTFKAWLSSPITIAITGATNTNPIVVHAPAHGMATGTQGTIAAVLGNTAANGQWKVTVVDADHFSVPVAGNGAYTSGGTVVADSPVALRALWTGDDDVANVRLDVDTVPRTFTMRAVAKAGGYLTGTYALFFECPVPSLASSVTVNVAQIQVIKVPRGSHVVLDLPYAQTTTTTRTVAAGVTLAKTIEGSSPSALPLQLTSGAKIQLNADGSLVGTSVDSSASHNPQVLLVPTCRTNGVGGADTADGQIVHIATTDATPAGPLSFLGASMPANCAIRGTVEVTARTTDYASVATWRVDVSAKVVAGALTVIGYSPGSGAPLSGGSVALSTATVIWFASGADLYVIVTGVVATSIDWSIDARVEYFA